MQTTTLGRTNLTVSVAGLGCGGPSRLGQAFDQDREHSVAVVRRALDLGVNLIDTAEAYRTEPIVADAIRDIPRQQVVLSTKKGIARKDELLGPGEMIAGLEASLQRLRTDYVDIYHLHGVKTDHYPHAREQIIPALLKARDQGKLRHLAVSERFERDTTHTMLQQAIADDCFDVVMVGFNMLNHTARDHVFPQTQAKGIGTLIMFAVRRALSQPDKLRDAMRELVDRGEIDADAVDLNDPLRFVLDGSDAESLVEAGYRFCRHEPGADVVLTGTSRIDHLEANLAAIQRGPLPDAVRQRLRNLFAQAVSAHGS